MSSLVTAKSAESGTSSSADITDMGALYMLVPSCLASYSSVVIFSAKVFGTIASLCAPGCSVGGVSFECVWVHVEFFDGRLEVVLKSLLLSTYGSTSSTQLRIQGDPWQTIVGLADDVASVAKLFCEENFFQ